PPPAARAPLLRLWHPPLPRQSPRRAAVAHPVGGDPQSRSEDRGIGQAGLRLLELSALDQIVAGAPRRLNSQSGELGGKAGRRFSRCEAKPSLTSGPVKPRNSSASDVSKVGPRSEERRVGKEC